MENPQQLYTRSQRGLLEEMEGVIERRMRSEKGNLSLVCVAGVTEGLAAMAEARMQAAQCTAAEAEIGFPDDDEDTDGEDWKMGQPA